MGIDVIVKKNFVAPYSFFIEYFHLCINSILKGQSFYYIIAEEKRLIMEISLNKSLNRVLNINKKDVLEADKIKLLFEIKNARSELANAYNNFNFVSDSLLVDYFIYHIKTCETRYEYLIRLAKVTGLNNI